MYIQNLNSWLFVYNEHIHLAGSGKTMIQKAAKPIKTKISRRP